MKHVQGPGCYGHNGADDAAADAAVIAFLKPGTPVRVQWRLISRALSVRETEALVKRAAAAPPAAAPPPKPQKDIHTRAAEEQLRLALGTDVTINRKRKGGMVEISFSNEDELQRIYEYLTERK